VLCDFLSRIDEKRLSEEAQEVKTRLFYVVKDIERIGDVLAAELVGMARKKSRKGLDFSIEGAHRFELLHRMVADDFAEALDLFEGLPASGAKVLENASKVDEVRREISRTHMQRLAQGVKADVETSRIFLDAVAAVRSIHFYACDIVQVLSSGRGTAGRGA